METNARTQDSLASLPSAPLSPADALLWDALPHLQLNIAQTATLCAISVRQLGYWTKQGYVTASGHGARRMYGLDALRRVLAIKNLMAGGASLRQALKSLPEAADVLASPVEASEYTPSLMSPAAPAETRSTSSFLSSRESEVLSFSLLALFAANRHTRDDASGLAVKIGHSTTDVRIAAEGLCARGVLSQTVSQGSVVFESVRKEAL